MAYQPFNPTRSSGDEGPRERPTSAEVFQHRLPTEIAPFGTSSATRAPYTTGHILAPSLAPPTFGHQPTDQDLSASGEARRNQGQSTRRAPSDLSREAGAPSRRVSSRHGRDSSRPIKRRITRACDQCNRLRTRCDGQEPCGHCRGTCP